MHVSNNQDRDPNSNKRFDRIILHIGTEKTGTKAIQQFLQNNRERMIAQNILYPKNRRLRACIYVGVCRRCSRQTLDAGCWAVF